MSSKFNWILAGSVIGLAVYVGGSAMLKARPADICNSDQALGLVKKMITNDTVQVSGLVDIHQVPKADAEELVDSYVIFTTPAVADDANEVVGKVWCSITVELQQYKYFQLLKDKGKYESGVYADKMKINTGWANPISDRRYIVQRADGRIKVTLFR